MTVHAPVRMTKEAFLAWIERREERYEYSGGRAIMMVHVTRNHAIVSGNLFVALKTRLSPEQYDVATEAFAVDVGDGVRFPDVLVEPAQADGKVARAKAPILIGEVISPGSIHLDFGDKLREYLVLPTLDIYLAISPDEPRIWVWQRMGGGFPQQPEIIEGVEMRLSLPVLQIETPFAEIYRGVR